MTTGEQTPPGLPLHGIRVLEFSHMVMGPCCGMVLGDLGAEVIKVEPLGGDNTRELPGSGAGFFPMFNRNKLSVALDVRQPRGREIALRLAARADVFSENFKAGAMAGLGLDHGTLSALHPRLVYVSHKGFLPGPYEHRSALDEVVQMMGGLAYMTGPEGRPLRAGSSVNDIMGGVFGALGVLAALAQRERTGRGQLVQSALFENNVLLVAQHMLQYAVTGVPAAPMPGRVSAWGVYDTFTVRDAQQVFLAVVTDTQWAQFCDAFAFADLAADARLATNRMRVSERHWLIPLLRERLAVLGADEIVARFESRAMPYAPITRPQDLFDDPHLAATGGLAPLTLADGRTTRAPLLPLALDGRRLALRLDPPAPGAHTDRVLAEIGCTRGEIDRLRAQGVVGGPAAPQGG